MSFDAGTLARLDRRAAARAAALGLSAGARATRLGVSENATWMLADDARRVALRVYRPGVRDETAIRSELAWIEALRRDDVVATPAPLADRAGRLIETDADGLHAVAFAWCDGREPEAGDDLVPRFHALGAVAARLHRHARRWRPPPFFRRPRWDLATTIGSAGAWGDFRAAPGLDAAGRVVLERGAAVVQARLERFGSGPDRFGLVHGDLRLANLLATAERLAVIDFDDSGFSWFAYDFAAAVSFMEDHPAVPRLQDAWCAGYRTVAPFADEAILPTLVLLRRLLLTAWIASHPEADTARRLKDGFAVGTVALARRVLET